MKDTRRRTAEQDALSSFTEMINDPIISVGLGIWMGEGFKSNSTKLKNDNRVAMGSTDPEILLMFLKFTRRIGIDETSFRARVMVPNHPEAPSPSDAIEWWREQLGFSDDQMAAHSVDATARKRSPKHPNGVCSIYAASVEGRVKINTWTRMMTDTILKASQPPPTKQDDSIDDW